MISIIVPIYNTKAYLDECIQSILNQSYTDFELLLVDDGSNDGSEMICDAWAEKDHRIVVIHKENGGQSSARNIGIENSSGEYLFFIDSDDYLDKDAIKLLYEHSSDDTVAMISPVYLYTDYQKEAHYIVSGKIEAKKGVELILKDEIPNFAHGKLFHKNIWNNEKFELNKSFEDVLLIYHILERAKYMYILPDNMYFYRQRLSGITAAALDTREDAIRAYSIQLEYAKKNCIDAVESLEYKIMETQARMEALTGGNAGYIQKFIKKLKTDYPKCIGYEYTKGSKNVVRERKILIYFPFLYAFAYRMFCMLKHKSYFK